MPLSDCAHIQTGVTKGRKLSLKKTITVPYLRVANVQEGYLDLSEMKHIEIQESELARYALRQGDVVLTEGGDFDKLGRGFVWRDEIRNCVHQNHVFAVRPKTGLILPDFLAYLATSAYGKGYFLRVAHRTTNLACINSTKLKAFPTLVPPLGEQRAIAHALRTVQRATEATENVIAAARQLKQSLMRHLFTYGPIPFHEADQVKLQDTEVGFFPARWQLSRLGQVISRGPQNGLYKPASFYGTGTPILRIDDFDNFGTVIHHAANRVRLPAEDIQKFGLQEGDIIVNRVNSLSHLGKSALIGRLAEKTVFESNMMRFCTDERIVDSRFVFHFLCTPNCRNYFRGVAKRAVAQSSINQGDVKKLELPLPPIEEQRTIAAAIDLAESKLAAESSKASVAAAMFETLLHNLMTGRIRVHELDLPAIHEAAGCP